MPFATVPIFRICDETEAWASSTRFPRGFKRRSAALRLLPLRRTPLRCPLLVQLAICVFFSERSFLGSDDSPLAQHQIATSATARISQANRSDDIIATLFCRR